jgi:hypothetical protein
MIVNLVSEEDDTIFQTIELNDNLIEELRTTFAISSEDELIELIQNIIISVFKDI